MTSARLTPTRAHRARAVAALAFDAALVFAFAATGRASHDSDVLTGLWQTAWPFLSGLLLGWAVVRAWRAPVAPLRTGAGVAVVTLIAGMLLRMVSGQGTALPFVVVAALTVLLLLVGWRLVASGIRSLRHHRRIEPPRSTERTS